MTETEFFKDLEGRSYVKMEELTTDRPTRRMLGAIRTLVDAEKLIPACRTIDEVEEIRASCQGIQHYEREHGDTGKAIVAWAKRCAVLCQLRITQIQEAKRDRKNGKLSSFTNFVSLNEKLKSNPTKLDSSPASEELDEHLKQSSIQLIAGRSVRP